MAMKFIDLFALVVHKHGNYKFDVQTSKVHLNFKLVEEKMDTHFKNIYSNDITLLIDRHFF